VVAADPDEAIRPRVEAVEVLAPDPEHLGDDVERQGHGDVAHEVAAAALGDVVGDLARELADPLDEEADHARRETLVHELPEPRVARVVHGDDRDQSFGIGQHTLRRGEDLGRLRDLEDVLVAREHPQVARLVAVDGGVRPEPAVRGVRIAGVATRRSGSGASTPYSPAVRACSRSTASRYSWTRPYMTSLTGRDSFIRPTIWPTGLNITLTALS